MPTLRDIKRRIDSVRNTRQITSAMKMVSTAKLSRAQNAVRAAQPYAEQLRRMVQGISAGMTGEDHPYFAQVEGGRSVIVLLTSDRGLCGVFNTQLNRAVQSYLTTGEGAELPEPEVIALGRVGHDFFRKRGYTIRRSVLYARESERQQALREIIGELTEQFMAGEVGRVILAYNHFRNPINQTPRIVPLLPVAPEADEAAAEQADTREALFEPSRGAILDQLLPKYLENQCFVAQLNTESGEHGARMVAMDGATRNAGEMIKRLTLQYNRARQAAITKELIEIVNGAQAAAG